MFDYMKKMQYTAAAAMMMVMGLCATANAAFDENLNDYTLDTMVVEADAAKINLAIPSLNNHTTVPVVTLRLLHVKKSKNVITPI